MGSGRIAEAGHHDALMEHEGEYARLINTHYSKDDTDADVEDDEENVDEEGDENDSGCFENKKPTNRRLGRTISGASQTSSVVSSEDALSCFDGDDSGTGKLTTTESRWSGPLSWGTYRGFIRAMGGYCALFAIILSYVIVVGMLTFNNWWLGHWIDVSGDRPYNDTIDDEIPTLVNDPKLHMYMLVYGGSLVVIFIVAAIKSIIYIKIMLKASSTLHNKMFRSVLRSPMSFFDTTPTGRILNRFSKDLDEIDVLLPINMENSLNNLMAIAASIITIAIIFPLFLIVVVVVFIVTYFVLQFYRRGQNGLKQLENVSRSPWFSHIGSTMAGLSTIHAYNKTEDAIKKFVDLLDVNAHPKMLFRMANRWAGTRVEFILVFVLSVTGLMVVFTHGTISPSIVGLALAYAMQLTGLPQVTMMMVAESQARFFSVERMLQYIEHLEPEARDSNPGKQPDANWPDKGTIQFQDYRMRYRKNLPTVLKSVSFDIKSGERIGIVGRTGSGKSSLSVSLFRLVEASEGRITIDGVDISELGLFDLRSKMSIIPQDPVMFIGTVRYNLDPFCERSDEELWSAIDKAYMKEKISSLDGGLESPVTEGGDNFSAGERQLLCMARALLRNSKILFLDEATAAIDTETDSLIQETIRSAFSGCTTLTIAHRLNTVLDSDRILVMKRGKVAEFDSPSALRSDPSSIFSSMLDAAEANNGWK